MVPQHTVIIIISIHDIAKEEINELINIVNERQVNSIASLYWWKVHVNSLNIIHIETADRRGHLSSPLCEREVLVEIPISGLKNKDWYLILRQIKMKIENGSWHIYLCTMCTYLPILRTSPCSAISLLSILSLIYMVTACYHDQSSNCV